ncbi:PAS domain-containing protein [Archangium violaceum]|nr:PAS domain-containing protein [Archangium violaceum]
MGCQCFHDTDSSWMTGGWCADGRSRPVSIRALRCARQTLSTRWQRIRNAGLERDWILPGRVNRVGRTPFWQAHERAHPPSRLGRPLFRPHPSLRDWRTLIDLVRIHNRSSSGHEKATARWSLSLALLLTVAVGVLLTIGLLDFDRRARHGLEQEALAQHHARTQELASELDATLRGAEQLGDTLAVLAGSLQEQRELEDLLRRMLVSAPESSVYGLGVWFEPGQLVPGVRYLGPYVHRDVARRGGPPVLTYEWSTPAYDYFQQSWYRQAREKEGRIIISEPYVEVDQAYETLSRAFFDDQGRLRGVVSVDLHLSQLRDMVRHANGSPSETFYVASPTGALLAHPQEEQLLAWARARGRPVRCLCELSLADLRTWEQEQGLDRGRYLTEVSVPQAGWRVFASTDERVLFKGVSRQRRLVVALCVMLWVGLGASGMAMARSERNRSLLRTLAERQRQEEERQRLLAQVRQRSAELQAILEGMVDAVVVTDAEGVITLANRAALTLFGQAAHDGTRLDTVYPHHHPRGLDGQDIPYDALPMVRSLRGEQVSDTELIITAPQKPQQLVLRLNSAPIRDESGRVIAAVSVVRDITQAIELERLQGDFVRMAAHELKTPLTVMKSFAQIARRTESASSALGRLLEGLCRGVDRMDRLVRTLLDASQLQSGQLRFEKEWVELGSLVEVATARTSANHPHNPIHLQPHPEAWVFGDRARLQQVLSELLDNAARYSPGGQGVEVALSLDGDEVELSIHDKGIGIPTEQRDRVFERFYRAHAGTPHDRGGLGLGLFLARGIVLQHGGRVELESREGEGTSVRLRLPRLLERQPALGRTSGETPARPPVEGEYGGLSR